MCASINERETSPIVGCREIDYRELKFSSFKPVGRGAFGVVFAAEWRGVKVRWMHHLDSKKAILTKNGVQVAVKKLATYIDAEQVNDLQSECVLLQRCSNHPNVVKFIGGCRDGGFCCIVTSFCVGGSVYDAFIVRRESLSSAELLRILRESACGILHLHKESVIHRDIAARNFLLDEQRNVFVTDFGLARFKVAAYQHTMSSMGPVKYM